MIVKARKLWENGTLTSCADITFNCEGMGLPRPAWLVPGIGGCLGNYNLLLNQPNPYPLNTLTGVYVDLPGDVSVVLDAASVQNITDICNGCCGSVAMVTPNYNGIFPAVEEPVPGAIVFTRTDLGDWYALNRAQLQYGPQAITGTFNRIDYTAGVSTYKYSTYGIPVLVDGDTEVPGESNRVFVSAVLPATLPAGQQYYMQLFARDGSPLSDEVTAITNIANLLTAIQADPIDSYGTWGITTTNGLQLVVPTTKVDYVEIRVGTRTV